MRKAEKSRGRRKHEDEQRRRRRKEKQKESYMWRKELCVGVSPALRNMFMASEEPTLRTLIASEEEDEENVGFSVGSA